MGLCNWQQQGLFSDAALKAYLLTLRGYVPGAPAPIPAGAAATAREHVRLVDFDDAVRRALPIGDALRWLATSYPQAPLGTLLRLYGRMHAGRYGTTAFAPGAQPYERDGATLMAHPMQITPPAPAKTA